MTQVIRAIIDTNILLSALVFSQKQSPTVRYGYRLTHPTMELQIMTVQSISDRDIHVWSVDLNLSNQQVEEFSQILTAQERQRAAKFINPTHSNRWTVARGYLRQILGKYINLTPEAIVFNYGAQGKPAVEGKDIQFNLSHSADRAVYAISAKHPVGIDLEQIHSLPAADLVDRFFSSAEQAIFHRLPIDLQQAAFFHAWTQKEAYLKACGTGLSTPLEQIEVSIDPRTPAAITAAPITGIWQIQKLAISTEYASAIVIGGEVDLVEYQALGIE